MYLRLLQNTSNADIYLCVIRRVVISCLRQYTYRKQSIYMYTQKKLVWETLAFWCVQKKAVLNISFYIFVNGEVCCAEVFEDNTRRSHRNNILQYSMYDFV